MFERFDIVFYSLLREWIKRTAHSVSDAVQHTFFYSSSTILPVAWVTRRIQHSFRVGLRMQNYLHRSQEELEGLFDPEGKEGACFTGRVTSARVDLHPLQSARPNCITFGVVGVMFSCTDVVRRMSYL